MILVICLPTNGWGQSADSNIEAPSTTEPEATRAVDFPMLRNQDENQPATGGASKDQATAPMLTVGFALAIVLGIFGGLVWLSKKYGSSQSTNGSIPAGMIENLGSTNLDARTRVSLLRCGRRILLIAQTAHGVETLCEMTDPDEVSSLIAACNGDDHTALASLTPNSTDQIKTTRRHRLFSAA